MTSPEPSERALLPDALRGLALGGILLVNMQNFAGYVPWRQEGADRAAQVLIDFLANGKWISTFAVLFGAGVWLLVNRLGERLEARRLLGLLALGLAHGLLIWGGDILANYALVGFGLLLLVRLPVLAQGLLALGGFLLGGMLFASLAFVPLGSPADPSFVGVNPVLAHPNYLTVAVARANDYLPNLVSGVTFFGPWLIALFLLGVLIARSGVLARPERFRRPLLAVALVTLPLGVWQNVVFARLNASELYVDQAWALVLRMSGGLTFALLYGALTALLVASGKTALLRPFASVGRLALSNYLFQSVVCTLIFYGYGFGQYGSWGAAACLAFGLGLFALQLAVSALYTRRFRRGPAEWLLRRAYDHPSDPSAPAGHLPSRGDKE